MELIPPQTVLIALNFEFNVGVSFSPEDLEVIHVFQTSSAFGDFSRRHYHSGPETRGTPLVGIGLQPIPKITDIGFLEL